MAKLHRGHAALASGLRDGPGQLVGVHRLGPLVRLAARLLDALRELGVVASVLSSASRDPALDGLLADADRSGGVRKRDPGSDTLDERAASFRGELGSAHGPLPAGILRGRCRRRTWSLCGGRSMRSTGATPTPCWKKPIPASSKTGREPSGRTEGSIAGAIRYATSSGRGGRRSTSPLS